MCESIRQVNERVTRDQAEDLIRRGFEKNDESLKARGYDILALLAIKAEHEKLRDDNNKRIEQLRELSGQIASLTSTVEDLSKKVSSLQTELTAVKKNTTVKQFLSDHKIISIIAVMSVLGNLHSIGGTDLLVSVCKMIGSIFGF